SPLVPHEPDRAVAINFNAIDPPHAGAKALLHHNPPRYQVSKTSITSTLPRHGLTDVNSRAFLDSQIGLPDTVIGLYFGRRSAQSHLPGVHYIGAVRYRQRRADVMFH